MRRSIPIGRFIASLALILVTGWSAACDPPGPTAAPTLGPSLAPPTAPPRGSTPPTSASVAIDPSLLSILPDAIDGIALEADPATAAEVAIGPGLSATAASLAVALAIAPGASGASGPSGAADLAIVSVVQLRPGIFDDAFFRDWRDTYDRGACEVAGGVSGHAESEIGGRTTYIGSCAGGAHTYHVSLPERGVLVSVTAAGGRRLGELVIAGLTE